MFSTTITLEEETQEKYGYSALKLKRYSTRKIITRCTGCSQVFEKTKREEQNKHQCSSIINELKYCVGCKNRIELKHFGPNKNNFDKLQRKCKDCCRLYNRQNKDRLYKQKLSNRANNIRLFLSHAMSRSKNRSIKKNIPFDLDLNYMVDLFDKQNGKCYYTNIQLNLASNACRHDSFTIDRLDSRRGYTKDNIVFSSYCVNSMKGTMNEVEFKEYLKTVLPLLDQYVNKIHI